MGYTPGNFGYAEDAMIELTPPKQVTLLPVLVAIVHWGIIPIP